MSHFHDRLFPKLSDSRLKELEKAAYQDADKLTYNEAKVHSDELDDIELDTSLTLNRDQFVNASDC